MRKPILPEYKAWKQARQRCRNPQNPDYRHYGGRGIEIRFETFAEFLNALKTEENPTGLRPSSKHSIDRYPNNNGHYEKGNVRWATVVEQRINRRTYSLASNNASGTKGVAFVKQSSRGKTYFYWRAYGYRRKKNHTIGYFHTLSEATAARKAWEHAD